MSGVTCKVSHVKCHASGVKCHIFFLQSGVTSWWMVVINQIYATTRILYLKFYGADKLLCIETFAVSLFSLIKFFIYYLHPIPDPPVFSRNHTNLEEKRIEEEKTLKNSSSSSNRTCDT